MWPFKRNDQQDYGTGGYGDLDPDTAVGHIQNFAQNAPQDVQQSVYERHFANMPYEHRRAIAEQVPRHYHMNPDDPSAMAHGFTRFSQERPDMLERVLRHPLLLGGTVALGGLILKHHMAARDRRRDEREYEEQGPWWAGRPW